MHPFNLLPPGKVGWGGVGPVVELSFRQRWRLGGVGWVRVGWGGVGWVWWVRWGGSGSGIYPKIGRRDVITVLILLSF